MCVISDGPSSHDSQILIRSLSVVILGTPTYLYLMSDLYKYRSFVLLCFEVSKESFRELTTKFLEICPERLGLDRLQFVRQGFNAGSCYGDV